MTFEEKMRQTLRLALVQRQIFCPATGDVLDIRTAKFLVDSDGDPAFPLAPGAYDLLVENEGIVSRWADRGLFVPA